MKRKKLFFATIVLSMLCFLTGCSVGAEDTPMDQLSKDGNYHYRNKELGFSLVLPSEFIYYQTQRKDEGNNKVIEVFVPTNDISYPQEVPSYAKVVTVKVFNNEEWQKLTNDDANKDYNSKKENGGKVYTIKIWDEIPRDWKEKDKWSQDMKDNIINGFSVE
jgi:hypothetical protein